MSTRPVWWIVAAFLAVQISLIRFAANGPFVDEGLYTVAGLRVLEGKGLWSARRRALSRWGNRYARWMLTLPLADATSEFRAYRADIVARLDLHSIRADGCGFQIEMVYRVARAGGEIVEVPVAFVDRRRGASKMSSRIVVEALLLVSLWGLGDLAGRRRAADHPPVGVSRAARSKSAA